LPGAGTDGRMETRTKGRADGRTVGRMEGWKERLLDGRADGRKDGTMDGRAYGRTYLRLDGLTDRRTSGWTDGPPSAPKHMNADTAPRESHSKGNVTPLAPYLTVLESKCPGEANLNPKMSGLTF